MLDLNKQDNKKNPPFLNLNNMFYKMVGNKEGR